MEEAGSLEDTREIRADEGLREILPLEKFPSSDATVIFAEKESANVKAMIWSLL